MRTIMVRAVVLACAVYLEHSGLYSAVRHMGRDSQVGATELEPSAQRTDPAYWGLKAGAYVPSGDGCWGGNFKASRNHNTFDYEICTEVKYL